MRCGESSDELREKIICEVVTHSRHTTQAHRRIYHHEDDEVRFRRN